MGGASGGKRLKTYKGGHTQRVRKRLWEREITRPWNIRETKIVWEGRRGREKAKGEEREGMEEKEENEKGREQGEERYR